MLRLKILTLACVVALSASPTGYQPHSTSTPSPAGSSFAASPTAMPSSPRPLPTPRAWLAPGGQVPAPSDPTRFLPASEQRTFQCIRFHESKNHVRDGQSSQGWYQFTQATWAAAARALGIPFQWSWQSWANRAGGNVQSRVAVWYLRRNGRFGVEWAAEAGECPGRF